MRDDHVIAAPAGRVAKTVVVGLYVQEPDGKFTNFGQVKIPLNP